MDMYVSISVNILYSQPEEIFLNIRFWINFQELQILKRQQIIFLFYNLNDRSI